MILSCSGKPLNMGHGCLPLSVHILQFLNELVTRLISKRKFVYIYVASHFPFEKRVQNERR